MSLHYTITLRTNDGVQVNQHSRARDVIAAARDAILSGKAIVLSWTFLNYAGETITVAGARHLGLNGSPAIIVVGGE